MKATHDVSIAQVDGLSFSYGQRPVFTRWGTRLPAGVTLVRGGESSGKTTLLRLLAGELRADAGVLRIGAVRLDEHPAAYRSQVFRTDPQSELPPQLSAWAWLDTLSRRYPNMDRAAVPGLVAHLGLSGHQDKPLHMLSTGSRRKVWLVAAWACGAPLTLLDQPFGALDKQSIRALCHLLRDTGTQPGRAWVIADYEPPPDVSLLHTITLD